LHYRPEIGHWFWKVPRGRSNKIKRGERAGFSDQGVWRIYLDGKLYLAARLAFLYMIGRFPYHNAVHINANASDGRWENLKDEHNPSREKMKPCNTRLARLDKKAKWPLGIFRIDNRSTKFVAKANLKGKLVHIGVLDDPNEAAKAYQEYVIAKDPWCAMLTHYEWSRLMLNFTVPAQAKALVVDTVLFVGWKKKEIIEIFSPSPLLRVVWVFFSSPRQLFLSRQARGNPGQESQTWEIPTLCS
jgi:hypothetical protein